MQQAIFEHEYFALMHFSNIMACQIASTVTNARRSALRHFLIMTDKTALHIGAPGPSQTHTNGTRIHSAVLPQYTFQTKRQVRPTDRQTDIPTEGLVDKLVPRVLEGNALIA